MAMVKCRECNQEISSEAKVCPQCGIKKPYKKGWKDMPLWQRIFVIVTLGPIALMLIIMYINREDTLYQKVIALKENQYQEKYKGYLKLHEIDGLNPKYTKEAIKYAKLYLKKIPVIEPEINLAVYNNLADLEQKEDYTEKINFYTFMRDIATECAISSQNMSRKSLNNKSTYNSILGSYGKWIDKSTYKYVDIFEGANSFGVVSRFTATYLCNVDFDTRKYSVVRVSLVRE